MKLLHDLSPETISLVFQSCNTFSDVISLSLTCKSFHEIWTSQSAGTIWAVGRRTIPGFRQALIAIRSIEIVYQAQIEKELPPKISLSSISGHALKPTSDELFRVFDLQNLVEYIEDIFEDPSHIRSSFNIGLRGTQAERKTASVNFHKSLYRVFIAGAALSHYFQEPFFSNSPKRPDDFLQNFFQTLQARKRGTFNLTTALPISSSEAAFLRTFPIYDFENYQRSRNLYSAFVEWFSSDVMEDTPPLGFHHETAEHNSDPNKSFLVLEIARFMLAYTQLSELDYDSDNENKYFQNLDGKFGKSRFNSPPLVSRRAFDLEGSKSVHLTLMGVFRCEEMILPNFISNDIKKKIIAMPLPGEEISSTTAPDISTLLLGLFEAPGRPNMRNDCPAPHPPLHLFEAILREKCGYRFGDEAFMVIPDEDGTYKGFGTAGVIFEDDLPMGPDDFTRLIVEKDTPFESSYGELEDLF